VIAYERYPISKEYDIITNLKKKDVFYLKADKGNSMVVIDRAKYEEDVLEIIHSDGFEEVKSKNPLTGMIKAVKEAVKNCEQELGIPVRRLVSSNPQIPTIYILYKTHKKGTRPIIANVNSPTTKIAKFLVEQFNKLPQPEGLYVKNNFEVADELNELQLNSHEELVSFDVTALYPNVPIDEALETLNEWLYSQDISDNMCEWYFKLTKLCMKQTTFQFRGKFYRQVKGTSMGNPLSCFIANIFMSKLELKMKSLNIIPRYWRRYVDDVLVITNQKEIPNLLNQINEQHPSIKFTIEREKDNCLPFLDLLLKRKENSIEIGIYRKPTNTDRYITKNSFTTHQHKYSAFRSMIHRLYRLPLNINNFMTELKNIERIASVNGFKKSEIDNLVHRHCRKLKRAKITTLKEENKNNSSKFRKFTFLGTPSMEIERVLRDYDIRCVFGNKGKLRELLGNPKDKPLPLESSGIYSIQCENCPAKYIGQTRRKIKKRFAEHVSYVKKNEIEKSSIAKHMNHNDHLFTLKNLKVEKLVHEDIYLDAFESYFIQNNEFSMNADDGPIPSTLFKIPTNF
jgi:hypothetical protein